MLTNCGCVANSEQTQILRPCLLHAQWAKAYATTAFQARVTAADVQPASELQQRRARAGTAR